MQRDLTTRPESGQPALPFVQVSDTATVPPSPAAEQLAGAPGQCDARPGARSRPGLVISRISGGSPYVEVSVYRADVVVKRRNPLPEGVTRPGGGKRGRIVELSAGSKRRLLFVARNLVGLETLLTLTYPGNYPADGRLVKAQWAKIRKWLVAQGLGGMMVLEFQKRGAPHFHVFLNGRVGKLAVSQAWFKIVGSGDPRHLVAGTRIEQIRSEHAAGAYAAKYVSKSEQKQVPAGYEAVGRFWSLFGGVKAEPVVEPMEGPSDHQICEEGAPAMAPLVRWVRQVYRKHREAKGLRPRRDNGLYGFKAWDVGPQLQRIFRQQGWVWEPAS